MMADKTGWNMLKIALAAIMTLMLLPAAADTAAIDNERVTVRDFTLTPDGGGFTPDAAHPYVILMPEGGALRRQQGASQSTTRHAAGDAIYGDAAQAAPTFTAISGPAHLIAVTLKDKAPAGFLANKSGLPLAFPRPGSRKVLENARVRVWDYTWIAGRATPMHFHDKEVVVIYRGYGDLSSTTPDGKTVINAYRRGDIKFNKADRIHSESLVRGEQSAMMVELK